jgi:hypothetical protein
MIEAGPAAAVGILSGAADCAERCEVLHLVQVGALIILLLLLLRVMVMVVTR